MLRVDDEIRVIQLDSPEAIAHWRPGFIGAYQTVFAGEPYFERFYPSEAEGVYRKLTRVPENITLIAARGESQVVGFGIAIPLRAKPDVARHLTGLAPIPHTFYLAELGVLPDYRGRGIGRALVRERLRLIDRERYTHVILRVAASRNASYDMYCSMGFEDMGVYMEVRMMRVDGQVSSDRRLFLCSVLSQVRESAADVVDPG